MEEKPLPLPPPIPEEYHGERLPELLQFDGVQDGLHLVLRESSLFAVTEESAERTTEQV